MKYAKWWGQFEISFVLRTAQFFEQFKNLQDDGIYVETQTVTMSVLIFSKIREKFRIFKMRKYFFMICKMIDIVRFWNEGVNLKMHSFWDQQTEKGWGELCKIMRVFFKFAKCHFCRKEGVSLKIYKIRKLVLNLQNLGAHFLICKMRKLIWKPQN